MPPENQPASPSESPPRPDSQSREDTLIAFYKDRRWAHKSIFVNKHPQETPAFHYDIMDLWASPARFALVMAFRGAAKSTLAEEAITLSAAYREFHNCVILADTWTRAVDHLQKIRMELETNGYLEALFGSLVGRTWTDDKLVLANGVVIQALGRGQSLRGSKHLDWRPDLAFLDDVEDSESCASDEAVAKTVRWLTGEVMPAMAPMYKMRLNGTPLHPRSMLMLLGADPGWQKRVYPIEYLDRETGARTATWPERFPLDEIDANKAFYERHGLMTQYNQEFMCQAEDMTSKPFSASMFTVEPVVRTWQPVYVMYDPARTTNKSSSMTGKVIWSWVGAKLVVWDATGHFWKPDELISDIFATQEKWSPVAVYVEKDGLEEWLMQPIRLEQSRRGWFFSVRPVAAPRGKLDFIMQLQPHFKAKEIVFANQRMPELEAQLLSFPTGRIDVPNALAYAVRLRPGAPVYDNFGVANIFDDLQVVPQAVYWLALNASAQHTTGALLQINNGCMYILHDWVVEGGPAAALAGIVMEARMLANGTLQAVAPPVSSHKYDNVGLIPAAAGVPISLSQGGSELEGRVEMRALMARTVQGRSALRVSAVAAWTLRGLAGGFCFQRQRSGTFDDTPENGAYRTLLEGIESVAALMRTATLGNDERYYAHSSDGRKYLTALGGERDEILPSKSSWGAITSRHGRR